MRIRKFGVPLVALVMLGMFTLTASAASVITNGDFETGDLSGWTTFTTATGTIGITTVTPFDVTGDSSDSLAVRLHVGQAVPEDSGCEADAACRNASPDIFEGGGISQSFDVASAGSVVVSADVAAENGYIANGTGGKFELLVNGAVVDSVLLGELAVNETLRNSLSASVSIDAGSQTIAVRVSRPWGSGSNTPYQYIDNVMVDFTAADPEPDDEPQTRSEWLEGQGVPGRGISTAPGLQKPFNENRRSGR